MNDLDYSGDINPEKTWDLLKNNKDSHLIDCRTSAEWNFVGVPDLTNLGKNTHFVEWQSYPLMEKNDNFLKEISDLGLSKDSTLIFICRSGARSRSAAEFLTNHGYKHCFNFCEGFEGSHDELGHRGNVNGWKNAKLPGKQG